MGLICGAAARLLISGFVGALAFWIRARMIVVLGAAAALPKLISMNAQLALKIIIILFTFP